MKKILLILLSLSLLACGNSKKKNSETTKNFEVFEGGIVRGDLSQKEIALVFTSGGFYDGYQTIRQTLKKHNAKGSFFFTGDAYRMEEFKPIVENLKADGHYVGAHSDKHLLYCAWEKRDSTLVTKDEFVRDIEDNYAEMQKFGIAKKDARYFLPAYEYYNDTISEWTKQLGLQIVNFTNGTGSNADYTTPNMSNYRDSQTIYDNILKFEREKPNGLNGFMLLIHFGVSPERTDKLYDKMDNLMLELEKLGYKFVSIEKLLEE
jgi:peptidoglycan/xylan/chitin deacetylase (PgdA/CDA1 family)